MDTEKKNQVEIIKLKYIICKIKNSLDSVISRLYTTKKGLVNFRNYLNCSTQGKKKKKACLSDLWDYIQQSKERAVGVKARRENEMEKGIYLPETSSN